MIGQKITCVSINKYKTILQIDTDKEQLRFVAVGGCCSNSWFEHITGVKNVIGGVITEDTELHPEEESSRQLKNEYEEEITELSYISKIVTDKGSLEIEFRNSSNGYYSGWLTLGTDQYDRPLDLEETNMEFTELKEDF